jgi:uroporphyrinogen-III synthase
MSLPLTGKRILVTRGAHQANIMSEVIRKNGGISIEIPLLTYEIVHNRENTLLIDKLDEFDWIFFTSANGVDFFYQLLEAKKEKVVIEANIGAVGKKTDEALQKYGYKANFIPSSYSAEHMANEFHEQYKANRILLVRGNLSREILPSFFTAHGTPFSTMVVYETQINFSQKEKLQAVLKDNQVDILTFSSPSSIQAFMKLGGEVAVRYLEELCVCIGTTTKETAAQTGFQNVIAPNSFTVNDMIETLINTVKKENADYE